MRGETIVRPGNLANVAAYGWETVAGAALLSAVGVVSRHAGLRRRCRGCCSPASSCASCRSAIGPAIYAPLYLGQPCVDAAADAGGHGARRRSSWSRSPALTAVLVAAARRARAGAVRADRRAAADARSPRRAHAPGRRAGTATATRRYAHALALHLGLDRAERRHLARVTELAFARRADAGDPIAYARQTLRDPSRASWEAGHVGEWWNGGGGPAGLRGPVTPMTSRIVAVADTWSALTAKRRPAAQPRRRAGGARERRRHPLRPARRTGRLRGRGRGARLRATSRRPSRACTRCASRRRCAASSPRPSSPRRRHLARTRHRVDLARAVRSHVNSRARARPERAQPRPLGRVAQQAAERRRGSPPARGRPAARRRRTSPGSAVTSARDDRRARSPSPPAPAARSPRRRDGQHERLGARVERRAAARRPGRGRAASGRVRPDSAANCGRWPPATTQLDAVARPAPPRRGRARARFLRAVWEATHSTYGRARRFGARARSAGRRRRSTTSASTPEQLAQLVARELARR